VTVARRRASRGVRAERERASLEAVIESIGVETELRPLLSRVLAEACQLLGADDGTIGLVDDARDVVRCEATYALFDEKLGFEIPRGAGLTAAVLAARGPVRVRRYGDLPNVARPARAEHTVLGVPVWWDGRIIGIVGLGRAPRRKGARRAGFTLRDAATLADFARYAAIAIENAHRFARERHRHERDALIARVGQLASANLLLDDLLQRTADAVHELLGYENVAIPLMADDDDVLDLRAFGGEYKRVVGGVHRLPVTEGIMGAAARSGETILVNDVAADPRHYPTPGVEGIRAELAVPIILGARVLGVLNVESRQRFTEEDAAGLRVVAQQLAVAIENARLFDAAREAAMLGERHRLARELHDAVAQQLFSASLVAQAVGPAFARDAEEGERRAQMLVSLTRTALAEMRALLCELRPLRADPVPNGVAIPWEPHWLARVRSEGLPAALRAYASSPALTGLTVTVSHDGYTPQRAVREEALFRIAQEALHNVVKHARATRAEVSLAPRGDTLLLVVRDDGVGFSPDDRVPAQWPTQPAEGSGGLGLRSMRERAAELGGSLRIARAPSRGTLVEAAFPLESPRGLESASPS
jgi:signal transduction histidine kinase